VARGIYCCPNYCISFALSPSLCYEECVHPYTSLTVKSVFELPLVPNNIASETFVHKSVGVRSVNWIFIMGCRPGGDWENT
jgi:hypothetical protein